jgi:hypothetical protein
MQRQKRAENMTDESFKYTQHNPDGTKEVRIGSKQDLYIFIRDRMDLQDHQLQKQIDWLRGYIKTMNLAVIGTFTCILVAVACYLTEKL